MRPPGSRRQHFGSGRLLCCMPARNRVSSGSSRLGQPARPCDAAKPNFELADNRLRFSGR
jgi:hypothetical protein